MKNVDDTISPDSYSDLNEYLLAASKDCFYAYLDEGANSNAKVKILHRCISKALLSKLNDDCEDERFTCLSLSPICTTEESFLGKYMSKHLDIAIKMNDKIVSGVSVKFVMSNYKQNSRNYFENMLGETANIRRNDLPYFQIQMIMSKMPYFEDGGTIQKWEYPFMKNGEDNTDLEMYIKLSNEKKKCFYLPNKTFLGLITISDFNDETIDTKQKYEDFCKKNIKTFKPYFKNLDGIKFGNNVVFNDFDTFIKKISDFVKSLP